MPRTTKNAKDKSGPKKKGTNAIAKKKDETKRNKQRVEGFIEKMIITTEIG